MPKQPRIGIICCMTVQKIRFWLMLTLVFAAPLSLHPSIWLPVLNFPSFRIGLYQVLAIAFVLSALPLLWQQRQIFERRKALYVAAPLALALVWGIATSPVLPRTLLYSASLLALASIGIAAYLAWNCLAKDQRRSVLYAALWSGLIFGGLAIGQLLLVSFGILPATVLCAGCTSGVFGFPRVNLFAAEPQFLASSLLPALFVAIAFWRQIKPRWLTLLSLILTSIAISVTFSRGAYLAIGVALAAYLAVLGAKRHLEAFRHSWPPIAIAIAGFATGWLLLIGSATMLYWGAPNITYNTAVSALNHLTLGVVDIPEIHQPAVPDQSAPMQHFDPQGFVEASSGDRLSAAETAVRAWSNSPLNILLGVGMGNLGAYVQQNIMQESPRDLTVYIFYILVMSELGLVGLTVLVLSLAIPVLRSTKFIVQPRYGLAFMLTLAFATQFWFFGSYINIMYIPLWMGIIYGIYANKR